MKDKIKKWYPYLILFLVTLVIGFPLLRTETLSGHDGVFHLFRSYSTIVALKDGQRIPIINPNMIGGLGYGVNIFYGVLTTYLTTFLSLFIHPIGLTINILILFSIFFSGLFMYFFVKEISNKKIISLLSAIIYMTSPYLLYDIYVRMALGEIVSFTFMPLVFHGLYNILYKDKKKWYLLVFGTSGLFLTHNLSTFLCAIFAFLFLLLSYKKLWDWEVLKKLLLSAFLSIVISLPTIFPLLEAKLSSDYMVFDAAYMHATGIDMEKNSVHLLKNSFKIPNQMVQGYMIIILLLIVVIFYLKKKKSLSTISTIFFFLSFLSLILTLSFIPWRSLPTILSTIQFPYRFLQVFSFFFAVCLSLFCIRQNKKIIYALVLLCFITTIPFLNIGVKKEGIDNNLVFSNKLKKRGDIVRSTGSASAEYLPRNAIYKYDYFKSRGMDLIPLKGEATIENCSKNGTHLSFDFKGNTETFLELPFIYYPGYSAQINHTKIPTSETENGLLGIQLKKGTYYVEVEYRGSIGMHISYFSSLGGLLILFLIIIKEKKFFKRGVL